MATFCTYCSWRLYLAVYLTRGGCKVAGPVPMCALALKFSWQASLGEATIFPPVSRIFEADSDRSSRRYNGSHRVFMQWNI